MKTTGVRLAVADLLKGPTIEALATDVHGRLASADSRPPDTDAATDDEDAWEEGTL
jgi:hypothetical protein